MRRRLFRLALVALAFQVLPAGTASAQYQYGKGSYGSTQDQGVILFIEGHLTNPRNADNVVATQIAGTQFPLVPAWDDDAAARWGVGYQWEDGSRVMASLWTYNTSSDAAESGTFAFPIGPAISTGLDFVGDEGISVQADTEIEAMTADLSWGKVHSLSETLDLEWSAGLRYAKFEETALARYGDGSFTYDAEKRNEGEMVGARIAVRGTYYLGRYFLSSGLGFSMLDGELNASSSLAPSPAGFSPTRAEILDDGRSGSIRDVDVMAGWLDASGGVGISFGWEQSTWDDIASDLMRNLPGSKANLRQRDSVAFSAYKLRIDFRF